MSQTATQQEAPGLWAKLKRDANPAAEGKSWTPAQSPLGPGREGEGQVGLPRKTVSGVSGSQNKSFNPRTSSRKTSGSGDSDGAGGPGNAYLGGAAGKKRRGGVVEDEIDEQAEMEAIRRGDDDNGEDEEIPPEILSVLEEDKFLKEVSEWVFFIYFIFYVEQEKLLLLFIFL